MLIPDWGDQGEYKNVTTAEKMYDNGVEVTKNDIEVYAIWYENIDLNSYELYDHFLWSIMGPSVQNNQCIICRGFQVH